MDLRTRQDRIERVRRLVPHTGLALSTVLALVVGPAGGPRGAAYPLCVLAAAALAACWLAWTGTGVTCPGEGRGGPAGYAVTLVLIGVLIALSPLFGIFGFTGYLLLPVLPGRWRPAGVAATAALLAVTQCGGVGNALRMPLLYLALVAVNGGVAGALTYAGITDRLRVLEQERMVSELGAANERLRRTLEENAALHDRLLAQARETGVLEERQRLAGEIHDTIAQNLAGIVTRLEVALRLGDGSGPHVELARDLARDGLAEARRSVRAMRPAGLAEDGLPEALRGLAGRQERTGPPRVLVEVRGAPGPLPAQQEDALYRAAQEGLTNVAKHAAADAARVTLEYAGDAVTLEVVDDGVGGAGPRDGGFGLAAMRHRVGRAGGTLEIGPGPDGGTALRVRVPVPRPAPAG